jgi:MFS family permease
MVADPIEPTRLGTLRRRLYLLAFVDEFVPFAVLFTLWFADNGITVAQLSLVFVLWAAAALVLEVPSGMVADRVDRRRLIAAAFLLRGIGIAVWLVVPTLTGLLIGASLWAIHEAAASGAWEALIHDELEALDAERQYGVVIARVGQFGNVGIAIAALVSTPLLGLGVDLEALGWITAAMHVLSIGLVLSLPDVRWVVARSRAAEQADDQAAAGMRKTLRIVLRDRAVAIPIAVGAVVVGAAILDEYVPLLARNRGLDDTFVPLVFLTVWMGLLIGGELAARLPTIGARSLAGFVATGGVAALLGLVTDPVWTLPLLGVAYAAIEATWVVSDARLQANVPTHVRATVSSVRGMLATFVIGLALLAIALMSNGDDPTPGLIVVAIALIATAPVVARLPALGTET